ncbi:MAG TPA: hypothetical protein EYG80_00830 [Flavobacteriaceae bacterium]|nr:hypothetical protein [Flavobacteriaceae bacterium]
MKKFTFIIVSVLFITACNSTKKVEKNISKGDYDSAIEISVKKLSKNKHKKQKQKYILLLEEAFVKAVDRDNHDLKRFEKDSNPAIIEQIYETFLALDKRQEVIKPILPLHINDKDRDSDFEFIDYSTKINDSKATLSDYLYANASKLLLENNIYSARKAYADLTYLDNINPNFKDVSNLIEDAHFKGTNFVFVSIENKTNQIIPMRLEDDLLNFDTYGLDEFWTVFHSHKKKEIDYNYQLALLFNRIDVSPERILEKQNRLEKQIKDGFEYVLDANGHIAKDSLGNSIKVDKYIKVKCNYFEIHQEKASHIGAEVILSDKNNNILESFPLESEFVFIHDFAEIDGDKRALDSNQLILLNKQEVLFPSNEQMIFDTGEDLKEKLKNIIDDLDI